MSKSPVATRDKKEGSVKFVIISGVKVNHRLIRFIKAGYANLPTMGKVIVHPVAGKDAREACMVAMSRDPEERSQNLKQSWRKPMQ